MKPCFSVLNFDELGKWFVYRAETGTSKPFNYFNLERALSDSEPVTGPTLECQCGLNIPKDSWIYPGHTVRKHGLIALSKFMIQENGPYTWSEVLHIFEMESRGTNSRILNITSGDVPLKNKYHLNVRQIVSS